MVFQENVEKIFNDDIREKKRTSTGAFHMRGKGIRHGSNAALRTPYHFMSNKQKNQLNGEVKMSSVYDEINLTWEELRVRPKEQIAKYFLEWRSRFSNKVIAEKLGIKESRLYYYYNKYGITEKKKENKSIAVIEQPIAQEVIEQPITQLITKGLLLEYNGEYSSDQLTRIFTKLQLLTEGEENKFLISVSVSERVS